MPVHQRDVQVILTRRLTAPNAVLAIGTNRIFEREITFQAPFFSARSRMVIWDNFAYMFKHL